MKIIYFVIYVFLTTIALNIFRNSFEDTDNLYEKIFLIGICQGLILIGCYFYFEKFL